MNFFRAIFIPTHSNHPRYFRSIEIVAILAFFVYIALLAWEVIRADYTMTIALGSGLVLAVLFGYIAADFMSGFVHFLGDSFGSPTTPFVGPNFVFPFRHHHVDPKAITLHDFVDVNGNNCLVSLIVLIPLFHFLPINASLAYYYLAVFTVSFLLFIFLTNQIHKWAHLDVRPFLITWLQDKRIILSPTHHQVHHTAPFDTYFCITSGWLNPILTKIKFFDAILFLAKKKT